MPSPPTPSETGQVQGEVNASVLDVVDMSFDIDEKEETLGRRKRSRSDSKKVKKFKVTPLRVPIPTDENCKFSDDLDDTICKICDDSVTLTGMRHEETHQTQAQDADNEVQGAPWAFRDY